MGIILIEVVLIDAHQYLNTKIMTNTKDSFQVMYPRQVGSVTNSAKLAPDRDAITGQPIPGGPSLII